MVKAITMIISGKLIESRYVAESITMIAGRFGHVGLCQLRTKLKKLQCETSYIAIYNLLYNLSHTAVDITCFISCLTLQFL